MQEAIFKLPEPTKSAYQTLKSLVVDLDIANRPKALLLAELDDVFVEVQRVMDTPEVEPPRRITFTDSVVPVIQTGEKLMVDARTLHTFLDVGRDFQTWFKDRVDTYGWVAGDDYFVVTDSPNLGNRSVQDSSGKFAGSTPIDYHLTLSMAKELGMVENNAMGRRIRKYFIECEKHLMEYYREEAIAWQNMHERDCLSLGWLREKSLDKIDAEALVTLRTMWREERDSRLDFMSETYKEADIRNLGTSKEIITFLRPQLKYAISRLEGAYQQLTKYHGLTRDSVLCMRLEGVIEDFKFVDQWVRKPY